MLTIIKLTNNDDDNTDDDYDDDLDGDNDQDNIYAALCPTGARRIDDMDDDNDYDNDDDERDIVNNEANENNVSMTTMMIMKMITKPNTSRMKILERCVSFRL